MAVVPRIPTTQYPFLYAPAEDDRHWIDKDFTYHTNYGSLCGQNYMDNPIIKNWFICHYGLDFDRLHSCIHICNKNQVDTILYGLTDCRMVVFFTKGISKLNIPKCSSRVHLNQKWQKEMAQKFNCGKDGGNIHGYFKRNYSKLLAFDNRAVPNTYTYMKCEGMNAHGAEAPTIIVLNNGRSTLPPPSQPITTTIEAPISMAIESKSKTVETQTQMVIPIAQVVEDQCTQTDMTKDTETHTWVDVQDMTLEQLFAKLEKMKYNIGKVETVLAQKLNEVEHQMKNDQQRIDKLKELMRK